MSLLINELYKIKTEPEKYLEGEIKFERLMSYTSGVSQAESAYHVEENIFGEEFHNFVKKRHSIESCAVGLVTAIRWISGGEKDAFEQFYYELEAYLKDKEEGDFIAKQENIKLNSEALYLQLDKMRERPGMWLGEIEINRMYFFIKGFITAESIICGGEELYNHLFDGPPDYNFTGFVKREYGIEDDVSWYKILEFKSRTQNEAFARFFDLLDRFRETQ